MDIRLCSHQRTAFSAIAASTAGAAVELLLPYAARKQVRCFVVVSDEGENLKSHGHYFHELFRKYHAEVYPAKLVFVSFLEANEKGQMATASVRMGFGPIKFSFDKDRPDLTKLDALLGTLAVAEL